MNNTQKASDVLIDRKALMKRHSPHYTRPEINAPLSIGNGGFCYTVDFTGLQTFNSSYTLFPLCTMSNWGWHSYPDPNRNLKNLRLTPFDTWGREVGYAFDSAGQEDLYNSLRQNPHRFNLGVLGLDITGAEINDCTDINQSLNLWEASINSSFMYKGEKITVESFVHSDEDTVCVRISSALLKAGKLGIRLSFPYGSHEKSGSDFSKPHCHKTEPQQVGASLLNIRRNLNTTNYTVQVLLDENTSFEFDKEHTLVFNSSRDSLTLVCRFVQESHDLIAPNIYAHTFYDEAKSRTTAFWEQYWGEGGAIDLSDSTSPESAELERRITLSQYLMAIQNRNNLPPAETGLSFNSWYGKFHLEMHYWHSAWFPLWNRAKEMEKSLAWYKAILNEARSIAASQGYRGARWPKMCGPLGDNSPSPIAVLLAWQQPHPILLAELCYRQNQSMDFLEEYREIIIESAEFMLSFIHWDGKRYVLGPPLIPAQERFDPRTVLNPGYETEYFRWAFVQANVWLKRLGKKENRDFYEAAQKLAAPAIVDGVFPAHENCPNTHTQKPYNTDHPSMLGMKGLLPGNGIDSKTMSDTLDCVLKNWDLPSFWGWDFPMMAMTAARLGRRKDALRFLLIETPKNTYMPNGHNAQGDRQDLPIYLPGNGGLLLATAMMAAGWDGDDRSFAPGFPNDETFRVRAENLNKYI
ncbi:MAG: hypothetical protein LBI14_09945 [Treponema sp.]|jgi:hypothetical protein|nr:hypothetical protein [Treponema sp.]